MQCPLSSRGQPDEGKSLPLLACDRSPVAPSPKMAPTGAMTGRAVPFLSRPPQWHHRPTPFGATQAILCPREIPRIPLRHALIVRGLFNRETWHAEEEDQEQGLLFTPLSCGQKHWVLYHGLWGLLRHSQGPGRPRSNPNRSWLRITQRRLRHLCTSPVSDHS